MLPITYLFGAALAQVDWKFGADAKSVCLSRAKCAKSAKQVQKRTFAHFADLA